MPELRDKYPLTNMYVIDSELYDWAKQKAGALGCRTVSELIFNLLQLLKENPILDSPLYAIKINRELKAIKIFDRVDELIQHINDRIKIVDIQNVAELKERDPEAYNEIERRRESKLIQEIAARLRILDDQELAEFKEKDPEAYNELQQIIESKIIDNKK